VAQLPILDTVLVYVGIPAAVVAGITGAVFASGPGRSRRYRPGRPFMFAPVWFLSAPAGSASAGLASGAPAEPRRAIGEARREELPSGGEHPAGGEAADGVAEWPAHDQAERDVPGGASDHW
jgi:hypothetical protein